MSHTGAKRRLPHQVREGPEPLASFLRTGPGRQLPWFSHPSAAADAAGLPSSAGRGGPVLLSLRRKPMPLGPEHGSLAWAALTTSLCASCCLRLRHLRPKRHSGYQSDRPTNTYDRGTPLVWQIQQFPTDCLAL